MCGNRDQLMGMFSAFRAAPAAAGLLAFVASAGAQVISIPIDAGGRIPTNPNATQGPAVFTFTVPPPRRIVAGATVTLDMVHSWTEDLNITLTSPPGTGPISVLLFNHRGSVPAFADLDNTVFDDGAAMPIAAGVPPFRGTFRPEAPLAAFDGIAATGVWTLTINDVYFGDYGWLYRTGDPTFERRRGPLSGANLVITPQAGEPEVLMVAHPATASIVFVDRESGSVVDPSFINGAPQNFRTPFEPLQVGNQVWVSDQSRGRIFRYDLSGAFLGEIVTAMAQARGMEVIHKRIHAITTADANGAIPNQVTILRTDGAAVGAYAAPENPWDVLDNPREAPTPDESLITDINNEDVNRYSYGGAMLGALVNSCQSGPGCRIDFPGQMTRKANGNLLVAGFSAPTGIFEYDGAGAEVAFIAIAEPVRAAHELRNGNVLYTSDTGVYVYNTGTMSSTLVLAGRGRFINPFTPNAPTLCTADCDTGTGPGVLDIFDYTCFQNLYDAGDPYACECDISSGPGVCDIFDFLCYQNAYVAGCP